MSDQSVRGRSEGEASGESQMDKTRKAKARTERTLTMKQLDERLRTFEKGGAADVEELHAEVTALQSEIGRLSASVGNLPTEQTLRRLLREHRRGDDTVHVWGRVTVEGEEITPRLGRILKIEGGGRTYEALVDTGGHFDVAVPVIAGSYTITAATEVSANGRTWKLDGAPGSVPGNRRLERGLRIRYRPVGAGSIAMRPKLDDGRRVEPLPGVRFTLYRADDARHPVAVKTGSDEEPTVVFTGLEPGDYTVEVEGPDKADGFAVSLKNPADRERSVSVRPGGPLPVDVHFQRVPATVTGLVLDAATNEGLPGVGVVLVVPDGTKVPAQTGKGGRYHIQTRTVGTNRVRLARKVVTVNGKRWTTAGDNQGVLVEVPGPGITEAPAVRLVPDEHVISGLVKKGDRAVPHAVVEVRDRPEGELLAAVTADEAGFYEYRAGRPGRYYLAVRHQDGRVAQLVPVDVNPPVRKDLCVDGPTPPPATRPSELAAFPIMVDQVDVRDRRPAGSAPGLGRTGQVVESAVRDVLGWRPRTADPKAFEAALKQAFTCEEAAGHTECRWTPRSYGVQVQADLGALTGAQASIAARAQTSADAALPLLDGLQPLIPDADPEDTDATRTIVRSHIGELVSELKTEGGPRVQRVDQLFSFLLGPDHDFARPEEVGGELDRLRERFGLRPDRVNTLDEEENYTNFLILVDYLATLRTGWVNQRDYFTGEAGNPYLGTQLVKLSRMLAVVAETVDEVTSAMDSVFLGTSERQTVTLDFTDGHPRYPSMTVAELLAWVEDVATVEGPRLISDAGKDGVEAFTPTVDTLRRLVRRALLEPDGDQDRDELPPSYATARVQQAIGQLAGQLDQAHALAGAIRRDAAAV